MPITNASGTDIYWTLGSASSAPPLVLLNSIGTDMLLWSPVLPFLGSFHLLRIDTRGHGRSGAPGGDYSLHALAQDVADVMADAGIARAAVAGVSLGGMIAMELAIRHPGLVSALALICTSATMDSAAWDQRIAAVRSGGTAAIADMAMGRFFSDAFRARDPHAVDTVAARLTGMSADGYAGCGAAIRDMNLLPRLGAIRVPTLIVAGEHDSSTPFTGHGEHLARAIDGSIVMSLDCGHLAPLERPSELGRLLDDWLSTHS